MKQPSLKKSSNQFLLSAPSRNFDQESTLTQTSLIGRLRKADLFEQRLIHLQKKLEEYDSPSPDKIDPSFKGDAYSSSKSSSRGCSPLSFKKSWQSITAQILSRFNTLRNSKLSYNSSKRDFRIKVAKSPDDYIDLLSLEKKDEAVKAAMVLYAVLEEQVYSEGKKIIQPFVQVPYGNDARVLKLEQSLQERDAKVGEYEDKIIKLEKIVGMMVSHAGGFGEHLESVLLLLSETVASVLKQGNTFAPVFPELQQQAKNISEIADYLKSYSTNLSDNLLKSERGESWLEDSETKLSRSITRIKSSIPTLLEVKSLLKDASTYFSSSVADQSDTLKSKLK